MRLYRHLLREARYFPDPVARRYMESHLSQAFRVASGSDLNITAARQALFLLRNANAGHVRCLQQALLVGYGRVGQRRYMLLEPFFGPLTGKSKKEVEMPGLNYGARIEAPKNWAVQPSLQSLVESQWRNLVVRASKLTPVITRPNPPTFQGQTGLSLKYISSKQRADAYYNTMVKRLLPPLPQTEWDTLHGLIVGTEPWARPRRRYRPQSLRKNLDRDPILSLPPGRIEKARQLLGARPTKITRSLMTRLWESVIRVTPRLLWTDGGKWQVAWGKPDIAVPIFRTIPSASVKVIFGGVDQTNGRISQVSDQPVRQSYRFQ